MSLRNGSDYYKKMMDLQERLRRSEEERIRLEQRFSLLENESRSRHETCINRLRMRYIEFLEEQQSRDERNYKLLGALDRVDSNLALITAKTNRLGVLRKQFEASILRSQGNRRPNESLTGDSGIVSQNNEKQRKYNDFGICDNNLGSQTSRGSNLTHQGPEYRNNNSFYKRRPSLPAVGNVNTRYRNVDNVYGRSDAISRLLSNIESNSTIAPRKSDDFMYYRTFSEPKSARDRINDRSSPIYDHKRSSDYGIPGSTIGRRDDPFLTSTFNDTHRRSVNRDSMIPVGRDSVSPNSGFFNLHPSGYSRRFVETGELPGFSERFKKDSEGDNGVQRTLSIPGFLEKPGIRLSTKFPLRSSMQNDISVRENDDEGECVGRIVENELERYITKIRSLHRDADPRSLEDIDHEQNTSGDLLNVTLSDDGADLSNEERSKERGLQIPCESRSGKDSVNAAKVSTEISADPAESRNIEIEELLATDEGLDPNGHFFKEKHDSVAKNLISANVAKSSSELATHSSTDVRDIAKSERNKRGNDVNLEDGEIERNLSSGRLMENTEYDYSDRKIVSDEDRDIGNKYPVESDEKINSNNVPDLEKKVKGMILNDVEEFPGILQQSNEKVDDNTGSNQIDPDSHEKVPKTNNIIDGNDPRDAKESEKSVAEPKIDENSKDKESTKESSKVISDAQGNAEQTGYRDGDCMSPDIENAGYNYPANEEYQRDPNEEYREYDPNNVQYEQNPRSEMQYNYVDTEYEDYPVDPGNPQSYEQQNQGYAQDPNERYAAENPEGYVSDPNQQYSVDPTAGYVPEPNQRYPVNPAAGYTENPEEYVQDPNHRYSVDPNTGYADPNQRYPADSGAGYNENPEVYAPDPNQRYSEGYVPHPNQQYSEGYAPDPNQRYPVDPSQGYGENSEGFVPDSSQQYPMDPAQGYGDPNQEYPGGQGESQYTQQSVYQQQEGQPYASDSNYAYPDATGYAGSEIYDSNAVYDQNEARDYSREEEGTRSEHDDREKVEKDFSGVSLGDDRLDKRDPSVSDTKIAQNDVTKKKTKDAIKSLLDSDTESTIEKNVSNAESDFDFN